MELPRAFAVLPALALFACAAQTDGNPMTDERIPCHLTGAKWAGASEEDVCEIFANALKDAAPDIVARIKVEALSPDAARAVVFDKSEAVVAELELAVMDRQLGPSSWRTLARGVVRALAANAN